MAEKDRAFHEKALIVKATVVAAISGTVGSSVATLPFALRLSPLRAASVHDEVRTLGPALLSVDRSFLPGRPRLVAQSPDPGRSGERNSLAGSFSYLSLGIILLILVSYASPLSCSVREALSIVERLIDLPADP
jgi:hypothetical protein